MTECGSGDSLTAKVVAPQPLAGFDIDDLDVRPPAAGNQELAVRAEDGERS